MNDIRKLLGKRIKELRRSQKITQSQLAERANIDQRSLSHIECGDTFPSRALFDIAKALNVELPELFDFNHIGMTTEDKSAYIKQNIEHLTPEEINIVYRLVKSLR